MKTYNFVNSCLILLLVVFFFSCDKTDPLPISKASFEVINKNKLEKYIPVKFVNLSTNTATFRWDFGDGTFDSLNISPEHIYEEDGSFDVTLTASTEDGQISTEIMSIDIKTRVLVAFSVVNINFVNEKGEPWDDDDTGPDLVFIFGEKEADLEDWIFTDTAKNLSPADLPLNWEFNANDGMELTDEVHELVLIDADPENIDQPFEVMFGIDINPVQYNFVIKDDNDNGLLQVSIGGFAIDLFVTFALQ